MKKTYLADVTIDTQRHDVSVKPIGGAKNAVMGEKNVPGTMYFRTTGAMDFIADKRGTCRRRERDRTLRTTNAGRLTVTPSGSRVKLYLAFDRQDATEMAFLNACRCLSADLQEALIDDEREDPLSAPPLGEYKANDLLSDEEIINNV